MSRGRRASANDVCGGGLGVAVRGTFSRQETTRVSCPAKGPPAFAGGS